MFSLPVGTEMFHFPTFPPTTLYIQVEVAGHDSGNFKVSLFGNPRITARLPAPHGLSQVTTSFIGSWCLGIHRSHLVACYFYKDARVHCVVLKMRATPQHQPGKTRSQSMARQEGVTNMTDPSGPNSVSHHHPPIPTFHSPTTGAVLTKTSIR